MASHRVNFQLQTGSNRPLVERYENSVPCSKRDANYNLDRLQGQGERELRSDQDRRKLASAIQDAKRWIQNARNMDQTTHSQSVAHFTSEDGANCRIDIEIHAGSGHFTN